MQIQNKYSEESKTNHPQYLKAYMAAEIDNRRIQLRDDENNEIKWECGYCKKQVIKERGITTHIGKMRNETKTSELICPYCPANSTI